MNIPIHRAPGRKRKVYPWLTVDPLRAELRKENFSPAAMQRALGRVAIGYESPLLGTAVARMAMEHEISAAEWSAATKWDETLAKYREAIDSLRADPQSASFERIEKGKDADVNSELGLAEVKRHCRAVRRFQRLSDVLEQNGMMVVAAVRNICEGKGRAPQSHEEFLLLRAGLKALVAEFLGKAKKKISK